MSNDHENELARAIDAMKFDRFGHEDTFSIEEHGSGEALYLGRDGHHHGLNLVHLIEPAYQWPAVRAYLVAAANAAPKLLADLKTLRAPAHQEQRMRNLILDLRSKAADARTRSQKWGNMGVDTMEAVKDNEARVLETLADELETELKGGAG